MPSAFQFVALLAIAAAMLLTQLPLRRRHWVDHRALVMRPRWDVVLTLLAVALSIASTQLMARKTLAYRGVAAGERAAMVDEINPIDRVMAGRWDTSAKDAGRIFKYTAMHLVPVALLLGAGSVRRRLVMFWVYLQGSVINDSLTGITKGLVERLRPFTYIDGTALQTLEPASRNELLEDLASADVHNAFYSGDASTTAFGLWFFALVYRRYALSARDGSIVLAVSVIGIALGLLFRTLSGKHFPSDVVVGGIVGVCVAWSVVRLHTPRET